MNPAPDAGQQAPAPDTAAAPAEGAPAPEGTAAPAASPEVDALAKREAAIRESEGRIKALETDAGTLAQVVKLLESDPIALLKHAGYDDARIAGLIKPPAPAAAPEAKPGDPVAKELSDLKAQLRALEEGRHMDGLKAQLAAKAKDFPGVTALEAHNQVFGNWKAALARDAHADPLAIAGSVETQLKGIYEKLHAVYGTAQPKPDSNGASAAGGANGKPTTLPQGGVGGFKDDDLPIDLEARTAAVLARL